MNEKKEPGFTAGPWEFDGLSYITADNGQKMIAQIRGWGWLQYLGEEKAIAIQEANGNLLAAAPDLLKYLREACEMHLSQRGTKPPQEWLLAVAKAEGRS